MKENPAVTPEKTVNTWQAVVLLVVSILGIVVGKVILGGNITIVLIIDAAIVAALSLIWGIKWSEIEEQMKENFKSMTVPIVILMFVGMMVGTMVSLFFVPLVYYMLYRKR